MRSVRGRSSWKIFTHQRAVAATLELVWSGYEADLERVRASDVLMNETPA